MDEAKTNIFNVHANARPWRGGIKPIFKQKVPCQDKKKKSIAK